MQNNIKGKNILLLCENFYNYDLAIRDELYKLGAKNVFLKNAKFFLSGWGNIKGVFNFFIHPFEMRSWTRTFEKEVLDMQFDIFLCIENACFEKRFIEFLRLKNPNIKTILFLWDTYKTQQEDRKDYRLLFDKVYTFDKDDAKTYGMEYFPDFYLPQKKADKFEYDLSFVGTANGVATIHRFELMDFVYKFCVQNNLKAFLYLKSYKTFNYNSALKNLLKWLKIKIYGKSKLQVLCDKYKDENWLHFNALDLNECNRIQASARVLLDLNHKGRQGMTINCITALAHGQKLITTNKRIMDEPFYNPDMIYIMDENNPHLEVSFWNRPNKTIDLSYLRIDNWLLHITND